MIGFTKTLSIELGEYGIRANAILPGAVDGPRIQRVFEERAKVSGNTMEQIKKEAMSLQSLKRLVDPAALGRRSSDLTPGSRQGCLRGR